MEIRSLWNLADIYVRRDGKTVFEKRICTPGKKFGVFLYESIIRCGKYHYSIRWKEEIDADSAYQFCVEVSAILDADEAWKIHLALDSARISGPASVCADACCILIDTADSTSYGTQTKTRTKIAVVTCNLLFMTVALMIFLCMYFA
jgi:hypothetical protein